MGKKRTKPYRCSACGEECTKKELIAHCAKEHPEMPNLLYEMISEFVDVKAATKCYNELKQKSMQQANTIRKLEGELKTAEASINKANSALAIYNTANNSIANTLNLLSASLEPFQKQG